MVPDTDQNREFLQWRDTSFMSEFNPTAVTGVPKYYSWWDKDRIIVAPTPDANLHNSVKLYLERSWIIEYKYNNIYKSEFSQRAFICMPCRGLRFFKRATRPLAIIRTKV